MVQGCDYHDNGHEAAGAAGQVSYMAVQTAVQEHKGVGYAEVRPSLAAEQAEVGHRRCRYHC